MFLAETVTGGLWVTIGEAVHVRAAVVCHHSYALPQAD